jgi:cell division GTPase FtsZ
MNLPGEFDPADPLSGLRAELRASGWKTDLVEDFLSGAVAGRGAAAGRNSAVLAARRALAPLLLDGSIKLAMGVVIDVVAADDLKASEVAAVADAVHRAADPDAEVLVGCVRDETIAGVRVTVIALYD